ncbi:paraquat-inducible protein A [Paracoccaceae bacterium Fryx2]|nr:paraquat-inducible protein A [Paracoccaceae bacterium Fryx2]
MPGPTLNRLLFAANLLLALLFPVAWFAPLMTVKVSLKFWAEGTDLSVIGTLQGLWPDDPVLALLLTFAAIVAPTVKVLGTGLILLDLLSPRVQGALFHIGRFAMADVFLIAVYIAIFKGLDGGSITIGWGLYLFTGCILASMLIGLIDHRR